MALSNQQIIAQNMQQQAPSLTNQQIVANNMKWGGGAPNQYGGGQMYAGSSPYFNEAAGGALYNQPQMTNQQIIAQKMRQQAWESGGQAAAQENYGAPVNTGAYGGYAVPPNVMHNPKLMNQPPQMTNHQIIAQKMREQADAMQTQMAPHVPQYRGQAGVPRGYAQEPEQQPQTMVRQAPAGQSTRGYRGRY